MSGLVEATRRLAAVEAGEVHEPLVVLGEAAGGRVPHGVVVPQPNLAPLPPVRVDKLQDIIIWADQILGIYRVTGQDRKNLP